MVSRNNIKEQLTQLSNEYNFNFTPPPKSPTEELDKLGRRIGNRVSKKKFAQYEEDYANWKKLRAKEEEEAHYDEYLSRCAEIQSEFDDDTWKRRQKNIDRMVINVCYCDDYRGYESLILSSIPEEEQCYWYNSIFK